jgi:RNA polymerase sigma factor (TIGR02999 family)
MTDRAAQERELTMEVTELLQRLQTHDRKAMDAVAPLVYKELKKLASGHLRGKARFLPLETTVLVHEAFLKLTSGRHPSYENRSHFYGIASRVMRQVLVDTARARLAGKRGAKAEVAVATLPETSLRPNRTLLALHDALEELEKTDALKGQLIEMRFFGGFTAEESAAKLSISVNVVRRELRLAQAWLAREMAAAASLFINEKLLHESSC